jgi:hypothetical protein
MTSGQRGDWVIAIDGRCDVGAILMILSDRHEAESIAKEMRDNGQKVVARRLSDLGPQAGRGSPPRGAAAPDNP